MMWPVIMRLSEAVYPLNVAQRTAYIVADTLAIEIDIEPGHVVLSVAPGPNFRGLSTDQAKALILQHLNDFALRDQINRETAGLREVLARAALAGCGLTQ